MGIEKFTTAKKKEFVDRFYPKPPDGFWDVTSDEIYEDRFKELHDVIVKLKSDLEEKNIPVTEDIMFAILKEKFNLA